MSAVIIDFSAVTDFTDTVICHGVSHISPNNGDILTTALAVEGGLSAHMHTSWLSPYKEHRLSVTGETGSLVFDDTKPWSEKLTLYQDSITQAGDLFMIERASPLHVTLPESEPLKDEVRSFIRLCDEGVLPPTHIDEALGVQRLRRDAKSITVKQNMIPFIDHCPAGAHTRRY